MSGHDLLLYAGALVGIWLVPGPVWIAIMARSLSRGFPGAWPLAMGVAVGDFVWPLLAMVGLAALAGWQATFIAIMKWVAVAVFIGMGLLLIRHARRPIEQDSRLTKQGIAAGFSAGLAAIIGNPKAILFYVGVLPGFVSVGSVTTRDMITVAGMSSLIPFTLNLAFGLLIAIARKKLITPERIEKLNLISGVMLICVGLAIALF